MPLRFLDRAKFTLERQFVKGAGFQLLVVMAAIGLISLLGGLLVAPAADDFDGLGGAIWWAFLRLTDPGYLGDDVGTWRRIVSTLLTVSGYVVFLGALVAIMTRKLLALMTDLERGLTPVALRHHIVVLAWTNKTLPLLTELLGSTGRVQRFLERTDARRLRLVVLAENASAAQRAELTAQPGIAPKARQVIFRSGSAIQPEALQRVACLDASAIIIPNQFHGPDSLVTGDVETVKALLSIAAQARQSRTALPFVVAEIEDLGKRPVVERAYPGPLEVVAGDATISRLLTQTILHPGLSEVYNELLGGVPGNEIYVRSGDLLPGARVQDLAARCPRAIVLGLLRPDGADWQVKLLADSRTAIEPGDRIIMLARRYSDTQPDSGRTLLPTIQRPAPTPARVSRPRVLHRVLILGWNRRVPSLLAEFGSYPGHRFDVTLVSVVPAAHREREIQEHCNDLPGVAHRQLEADFMVEGVLRQLRPSDFDSLLLLSSDRLASGEEADARAMMGYLQLEDILAGAGRRPQLVMELNDPHNEFLLTAQQSEVLVSPLVLSHVLAQVALRRELRVVYEELFTVGGAEILFRLPADYGVVPGCPYDEAAKAVASRGELALGVLQPAADEPAASGTGGRRLLLNPDRSVPLVVGPGDRLVVLGLAG